MDKTTKLINTLMVLFLIIASGGLFYCLYCDHRNMGLFIITASGGLFYSLYYDHINKVQVIQSAKFAIGDRVFVKLDNKEGVVQSVNYWKGYKEKRPRYDVRFTGKDGYEFDTFREGELKKEDL